MTAQKIIQVRDVKLSNENSFALVGGLNVLESESVALQVAETFRSITELKLTHSGYEFSRFL